MRLRYPLAAPLVVAMGLASRSSLAPALVRTWAGDPLYGVLIYVLVRAALPGAARRRSGLVALSLCALVEVSQRWHPAWLDAVRASRLGALVLGRGFRWSDLAGYAVGVSLGTGLDWLTSYCYRTGISVPSAATVLGAPLPTYAVGMNTTSSPHVVSSRTAFRMSTAVSVDIEAPPPAVWALLTDPARQREWNSTLTSIQGEIKEGGTVELVAVASPGRTFKLKVGEFAANARMVWSDGFAPMFRGVRTFALTDLGGGRTRFAMDEVFAGLMLPMIVGSLPSFGPIFETYAADLKRAAEAVPR